MPLGIPKIPNCFSEDREPESPYLEVYNRLFYQRLLFLGQEIDNEVANRLIGMMIYLSIQDRDKDIYLFINSPGGKIIPGMAIFDGMQCVEADVQTICVGTAASMASLVLAGGAITKRTAFPHARVMIHEPACSPVNGQTVDCILEVNELLKMRENMVKIYAQRTGQPSWQIEKDMQRDFYMSAEEAKDYGIIDVIAASG